MTIPCSSGPCDHVAPTTPGSIHEGGELGYSLSHAFGAVFDNPGLIVACVIGDGEAETGPLATSWQSNKFLDAVTDGAVLPILLHPSGTRFHRSQVHPHDIGFLVDAVSRCHGLELSRGVQMRGLVGGMKRACWPE
jgi:hypothetical protein